jgi:small-conductance mechanosensitive channel
VISPNLRTAISVAVVELILVTVTSGVLLVLVTVLSRRAAAARGGIVGTLGDLATVKVRRLVIRITLLAALLIVGYNGWLVSRGLDARTDAITLLRSITIDHARLFVIRLAQLALIGIGMLMATRLVRGILQAVEPILDRWDRVVDEHRALRKVFAGLDRAVLSTAYLLGVLFACQLLSFPASIVNGLMAIVRIWAIVAFGIPIIQSTAVVVATSADLGRTFAHRNGLGRHFDQLHALLPTFRVCLDYALWVSLVTLVLGQVAWLRKVSSWGPILIEGIAIFFVGQVIIQLGYLEIAHRMLPHEGLQENERRRRATMVPLVRSAFMYAAYFATAVLILSAMGFNPMPFLAGAGILGLVVGFGAQSMINDVVSGFFILFENIYLVGDVIEVGTASGVVEAIEFRTTKIRDADGRLHIVRNGDMKLVVNYSKDYAVAAVALDVGYDADLRAVFASLHDAGEQLRAENPEILGETEIDGITAFGPSTMTIRTSTRVKPGCHRTMAAKLRLAFKETFDPKSAGTLRKALIPENWAPAGHTSFMIHGEEPTARVYR